MNSPAILVVEDDALIRWSAADLVISAGFEAVEAASADEAIQILEARQDIRLVFTDVEMPGTMDGIKLAHYIRRRWPPVQLIIASGRAIVQESDLPEGTRFFHKPYQDYTIVKEINRMMTALDARG